MITVLALSAAAFAQVNSPTTLPTSRPSLITLREPAAGVKPRARLLYLPGISAFRSIDRKMLLALPEASEELRAGLVQVYDWSAYNAGLGALFNASRNFQEARVVSGLLTKWSREDPDVPTYVMAHSGGCGVAIWALEGLPSDVTVDRVILLQPAVSPGYDLTVALRHLKAGGTMAAFSSPADPVLGTMTRVFGTIDRVNTESAGLNGFDVRPSYGNAFVPMPYRAEWGAFGHDGDHIGVLMPQFGKKVLAPLLVPAE